MHPALVGQVRSVRVVDHLPQGTEVEKLPDGSTLLMLQVLAPGVGHLSVAGPRTRALFKTAPPAEHLVLLEFEPGAARAFFSVPTRTLTDRYTRIEDLWGAEGARLRDRLLALRAPDEARDVLERALVDRLQRSPPTASLRLARRAVARLQNDDVQPRIAELAGDLGVSSRHLRRVFTDTVGVAPKEFARMVRLQRALGLSHAPATWTERAVAAGYYDQAHFIADFRDLVGTTPGRFSNGAARW
jgi:AraC-like DNA-binding protein